MKKQTHILAPRPPSPPLSTSFLPQGDNGDDVLIADDYANRLYGGDGVDSCTASGSGNSVTGCEP